VSLSKGRGAEGLGTTGGSRRPERTRTRRTLLADLALGVGSGVVLYAASRAFLLVSCGPFSRALCEPLSRMFERFETRTILSALVLGLVLAPAEELFWRGVLQARLAARLGAVRAVIVATLLAAAASLLSGEPFLALAMLPTYGAWGALAAWRRGLLAPIASHATWSVLVASVLPPM
jgi:membrane protease YdiL (CAAX protease family)